MVKCVISFDVGIPKFSVVFFSLVFLISYRRMYKHIYIYITLCESKCEAASNQISKASQKRGRRKNYKTRSELFCLFVVVVLIETRDE